MPLFYNQGNQAPMIALTGGLMGQNPGLLIVQRAFGVDDGDTSLCACKVASAGPVAQVVEQA